MHGVLISTERPASQQVLVSGAPGALSAAMVERLSPRTDRTPVVPAAAAVPHFVTTEDEDARSAHVLDAVVYFDHPSRRVPGQLPEVIRFAAAAAAPIYSSPTRSTWPNRPRPSRCWRRAGCHMRSSVRPW